MSGTRLEALAAVLAGALAQWDARDQEAGATAEQVRAAHAAVAAIDDALAILHKARQGLAVEIRRDEDRAMARTAALLEQAGARREAGGAP